MTITRRTLMGLIALPPLLGLSGLPAFAAEPETFAIDGVAIRGIDPVGYFTQSGPVSGNPQHRLVFRGAQWLFASSEDAALFESDPDTYGPQFGGYCAYAASKGYLAPTVPEAWTVYEGRLYLNANLRARELWLQDIPGNIAKGRANWPWILG